MKYRSIIPVVLFLLTLAAISAHAQGTVINLTVDGVQRQALVFAPVPVPANNGGGKHPLIFAWHGHGGNMQGTSQLMHLQDYWKEAVVVYPQGLKSPTPGDPSAQRSGFQFSPGENNDRDLHFFDALLAKLKLSYAIDDDRVYSTGFSNGAIFSYLLWAERGRTFAAFALVSGFIAPGVTLSTPRPAEIIGGSNDHVADFPKQQQAMQTVRELDQATGNGQTCGPICLRYTSASQDPVVTRIHSGGHVYPPWAADAVVEFLKLHKRQ
ncbi:MAG: esterase [Pyrinomonadaceae bacterium]